GVWLCWKVWAARADLQVGVLAVIPSQTEGLRPCIAILMNRTSRDLDLTPQLRLSGFQMSFERNELTVPKLSVLCLRRIASFARADALVEESALHRVARQSER